jgi:hypothetical protein
MSAAIHLGDEGRDAADGYPGLPGHEIAMLLRILATLRTDIAMEWT